MVRVQILRWIGHEERIEHSRMPKRMLQEGEKRNKEIKAVQKQMEK